MVDRRGLVAFLVLGFLNVTHAGDAKKIVGTYRLTERVSVDGKVHKKPPEVLGVMTFSKTQRSAIMRWEAADGSPVSIAQITRNTSDQRLRSRPGTRRRCRAIALSIGARPEKLYRPSPARRRVVWGGRYSGY